METRRLQGYDYSQNGMYFITILTKNRECLFGEIVDGEMILSEYGNIVRNCWEEIPTHYEGASIDEYCVMPNHLHGIIVLCNENNNLSNNLRTGNGHLRDRHVVGDRHACPLQRNIQKIPSVVGGFKSAVTKIINRRDEIYFQWQRSFYDRIIRNEEELIKIREYIYNNPKKW